jgi:hypothetical protein
MRESSVGGGVCKYKNGNVNQHGTSVLVNLARLKMYISLRCDIVACLE